MVNICVWWHHDQKHEYSWFVWHSALHLNCQQDKETSSRQVRRGSELRDAALWRHGCSCRFSPAWSVFTLLRNWLLAGSSSLKSVETSTPASVSQGSWTAILRASEIHRLAVGCVPTMGTPRFGRGHRHWSVLPCCPSSSGAAKLWILFLQTQFQASDAKRGIPFNGYPLAILCADDA